MGNKFVKRWKSIGESKIKAKRPNQYDFNLGSAATDFLFNIGMPSEFQELNFDYLKEESLQSVNSKWNLNNSDFDKYITIGFNGSGDPIAINLKNQELIYLNHDNEFEEVFINSDLKKFAQSILIIQGFIDQITKLNPDSFFETEFSDESLVQLLSELKQLDSRIVDRKNSHWVLTLENLKWEREEERNN